MYLIINYYNPCLLSVENYQVMVASAILKLAIGRCKNGREKNWIVKQ